VTLRDLIDFAEDQPRGFDSLDADEVVVLLVGLVACTQALVFGVRMTLGRPPTGRRNGIVAAIAATPILCLAGLFIVLRTASDPQVRYHAEYIALFMAVGGACIALVATAAPFYAGVSLADDALNRSNPATAIVVCGAMTAATITCAAANVGTGATIYTTLIPAALGVGTLLVLWLIHALISGSAEAVAVDRDSAAAIRTLGMYISTSIVLARAVAGNWVSMDVTLNDFVRRGWPAAAFTAVAVIIDRLFLRQPWQARRALFPAVILAFAMVAAASTVVVLSLLRYAK
jgi:hypothetical protein